MWIFLGVGFFRWVYPKKPTGFFLGYVPGCLNPEGKCVPVLSSMAYQNLFWRVVCHTGSSCCHNAGMLCTGQVQNVTNTELLCTRCILKAQNASKLICSWENLRSSCIVHSRLILSLLSPHLTNTTATSFFYKLSANQHF